MKPNSKKHIVFFTPTLNRTGSEIVLLELIKHASLDCKVTVITKFRGTMFGDIPAGIKKHSLYGKQYGGLGNSIYNRFRKLFAVNRILKRYSDAVWYINTIVLPDLLAYAETNRVTTILHTHELEQMYAELTNGEIARIVRYPKLIIANSGASSGVVKQHGRDGALEVIHPALSPRLTEKRKFEDVRSKLNIAENKFVWLMCGTLDANKNPFLFIEIAAALKKLWPDFRMVWIGGKADNSDIDQLCEELKRKLGLTEEVLFTGDVKNKVYDYFGMANGFVLTSQFESFSMVTLEAMYLQLPIVANDCIGVREVLGKDLGYIIEKKNDPGEFATRMVEIMKGSSKIDKNALRERAMAFEIKHIARKWSDLISKTV